MKKKKKESSEKPVIPTGNPYTGEAVLQIFVFKIFVWIYLRKENSNTVCCVTVLIGKKSLVSLFKIRV